MKAKVMVFLFSTLLFSNFTFACGDSNGCGGDYYDCGSGAAYNDGGCGASTSCDASWNQYSYYQTSSQPACDCDCTDNGWRYNDCMSKSKYCEAFGNVGAR